MSTNQKSFWVFVKDTKLPFVFGWGFNIAFAGFLALSVYLSKGPLVLAFMAASFIFLKLMLYRHLYQAVTALDNVLGDGNTAKKLSKVGVYIKDFNSFDKTAFWNINTTTAIYEFELADLVLTEHSVVLHGIGVILGSEHYRPPVELVAQKGVTSLPKAQILHWQKIGNRIEIKFHDPNYKHPIRMEVKDHVKELEEWLTLNMRHLNPTP